MKIRSVLFFAALLILSVALSGEGFYDIDVINEIEITFSETNWDQILDNYYAAGDEERLVGTALINEVEYDSVGVRYKGNSTYSPNRVKNPLNIKLDHIIDDQEIEGYGTLKLANVWNDPSFVRETLSYEIARKYMPASLANYIKVTINGQYLGLYTSVQSVDKFFAETNFGSRDNAYFKGELTNSSPQNDAIIWGYLGDDQEDYEDYYELKSDEGWEYLINFLDIFNNSPEEMESVLNVDLHLWMLAFDNVLVNLDAPINFAHNYYLYATGDGKFNPVIWDLNESFGVFSMLLNGGPPLNLYGLQHLNPYLNENNSDYPIISKVLENPVYKQRYVAHAKTMLTENFENGWYETRANELQDIIDDEVAADPNKFYTYSEFLQNVNNSVGYGPQSIVGITELMETRSSYLLGLSDFTATQPEIGEVSVLPEFPQSGQEMQISISISNTESAYFMWRDWGAGGFVETELFDDGEHNDGLADDGIYGNSIIPSGDMVYYYIVADNSEASAFSPVRASHEFYSIELEYIPVEDIAINEFMADNDNIVADEAGEYDDWLELYNLSEETIDIGGYFLSDDSSNIEKWEIPTGTEISGNGFLCFWADDDQEQGELHTNFKLSASGESIILSDMLGNIIDEIDFPVQETDISYGRYPDGEGEFIEMTPSFQEPNYDGITSSDGNDLINLIPSVTNYPNPFNPETTINFSLKEDAYIKLTIYNINGQRVRKLEEKNLSAGIHNYVWDGKNENGRNSASGVYFYNLHTESFSVNGKMVLMK